MIPDKDAETHKRALEALAATVRRERLVFHWSVCFVAVGILCAAMLVAYLSVRMEIERKTDLLERYALEVGRVIEREEFLVRRLGLTIKHYFSNAGEWERGQFDGVIDALQRSETATGSPPSDGATEFLILFPQEGRVQLGPSWGTYANAVANSAASGVSTLDSLKIERQAYLVGLDSSFAAVFSANHRGPYAEADADPLALIQTLRKKSIDAGRAFHPAETPNWKYFSFDKTQDNNVLSCIGIVDTPGGGRILFGTDISAQSLSNAVRRTDEYGVVGLYSPDAVRIDESVASASFERGAAKVLPHPVSGRPYFVREGVYLVEPVGNGFGYLVYGLSYTQLLDAVARSAGWVLAFSAGLLVALLAGAWQWDRRVLRRKLLVSSRAIENEILNHILVSAMPIGLLIVRAGDYSVVRANSLTAALLGMSAPMKLPPLVEAEFRARAVKMARFGSEIAHFDMQLRTGSENSSLFLSIAYSSSNHNGEDLLIFGLIDITAQKQAELASARKKEDADRQLRARSNFFASVSHEIKTPLSAIVGNIDLLGVERMTDADANRLDAIRASARSLLRIVTDILDLSRIDAGEMKLVVSKFNPHRCMEHIARQYVDHAISKNLEFQLIAAPEMARYSVIGDPNRIAQIIDNLLNNAFKFTAAGRIAIRTSLVVEHAASAIWSIDVIDSGCGVDEQLVDRIFTPFAQADEAGLRHGGTGLGLSICFTLCRLMGGDISVKSIPYVGAVFSVRLPVSVVENHAADIDPPMGRALIVTEMNEYGRNLQMWLTDWGWCASIVDPNDAAPEWSTLAGDVIVLVDGSASRIHDIASEVRTPVVAVRQTTAHRPIALSARMIEVSAYDAAALKEVLQRVAGRATAWGDPASHDADEEPGIPLVPGREGARKSTVLIVDDSKINRELLADQASSLGCKVLTAESGADALAMVHHNKVDIMLTDLDLPGMSGAELLEAVRAERPGLPVIAVSAYDLDSQIEMRLEQGFVDYLAKPVTLERLSRAFDRFQVSLDDDDSRHKRSLVEAPELGCDEKAQLLLMYSGHASKDLIELEALRAAPDPRAIERWLHRMRGTFLALGERALAARCFDLEQILVDADEWKPEWASMLDDIEASIRDMVFGCRDPDDLPGEAGRRRSSK